MMETMDGERELEIDTISIYQVVSPPKDKNYVASQKIKSCANQPTEKQIVLNDVNRFLQ